VFAPAWIASPVLARLLSGGIETRCLRRFGSGNRGRSIYKGFWQWAVWDRDAGGSLGAAKRWIPARRSMRMSWR
jgi:hypothetical protein